MPKAKTSLFVTQKTSLCTKVQNFTSEGNFTNVHFSKIKVGEVCLTASEVVTSHSEVFIFYKNKSEVFSASRESKPNVLT